MSRLSNFVKHKIQALVKKVEVPKDLWVKCSGCEQMVYNKDLVETFGICPTCDFHFRLSSDRRMEWLLDKGTAKKIEINNVVLDPLKFKDKKKYIDRLKEAKNKTNKDDAILVKQGKIGGQKAVVGVLDFEFMGGSMGSAVGEGIIAAAEKAIEINSALVVFTSSGGARMQEGILSLMQMPRTVIAVDDVKQAGLPYITVLTDPTTGGVTAAFAMLGDIAIAEPGAVIGFAGARVIEETIREKLPEGFQRAEYLLDHGMIARVVHRRQIRDELIRISGLLLENRGSADVVSISAASKKGTQKNTPTPNLHDDAQTMIEERPAAE